MSVCEVYDPHLRNCADESLLGPLHPHIDPHAWRLRTGFVEVACAWKQVNTI